MLESYNEMSFRAKQKHHIPVSITVFVQKIIVKKVELPEIRKRSNIVVDNLYEYGTFVVFVWPGPGGPKLCSPFFVVYHLDMPDFGEK